MRTVGIGHQHSNREGGGWHFWISEKSNNLENTLLNMVHTCCQHSLANNESSMKLFRMFSIHNFWSHSLFACTLSKCRWKSFVLLNVHRFHSFIVTHAHSFSFPIHQYIRKKSDAIIAISGVFKHTPSFDRIYKVRKSEILPPRSRWVEVLRALWY